jgi:hypothetical protein
MKRWFLFSSCDSVVECCVGHAVRWRSWMRPPPPKLSDGCLPDAPYRYHNSLVLDGKPQFGCRNRCSEVLSANDPHLPPARPKQQCGACRKGDHENCSNWCFCDCEFNR